MPAWCTRGPPVLMEYHALSYARTLDPVTEVLKAWACSINTA